MRSYVFFHFLHLVIDIDTMMKYIYIYELSPKGIYIITSDDVMKFQDTVRTSMQVNMLFISYYSNVQTGIH